MRADAGSEKAVSSVAVGTTSVGVVEGVMVAIAVAVRVGKSTDVEVGTGIVVTVGLAVEVGDASAKLNKSSGEIALF